MPSKLKNIKNKDKPSESDIKWLINQAERAEELVEIVMLKDREYIRLLHELNKQKGDN